MSRRRFRKSGEGHDDPRSACHPCGGERKGNGEGGATTEDRALARFATLMLWVLNTPQR